MKGFTLALFFLLTSAVAFAQQQIVKTVTIHGSNIVSEVAIRAAMTIKEGAAFQQSQLRADESRILDLGYFKDVKILTRQLSDTEVELQVEVAENPVIKEIAVKGNTVITTQEITAAVVQIQELGKIYNNRFRVRIQDAVTKLYSDKGYLVGIDQLQPDPASEGTLLVSILEPKVREIRLQRKQTTKDGLIVYVPFSKSKEGVIRKIMKVKPGDAYNEQLIRNDYEELWSTRWFEDIIPKRLDTPQPGVFDLELTFIETRTGQINGGVALDPQSRLVGFISYSDSDFRDAGQSVGANLSQATVGGGLSAEFAWGNRFYDSRNTSMSARVFSRVVYNFSGNGLGGFDSPLDGNRSDERRTGFELNFARPFDKVNHGRFGMRYENVKSINLDTSSTATFVQQDGDLFNLRFGVDKDTRHPSLDPFRGQMMSLVVEPSFSNITKIGGSVSTFDSILGPNYYLRTTLEFRKYWSPTKPPDTPITAARPVTAFKATYGIITGDVPFFEQMFVGGLGSVRGWQNQRFWGKQSFVTTLEYRYPIQSNFSVVAFTDYGGAWGGYPAIGSFTQTSSMDFHLGYGLGVSFRTPIGPIRIDFAFNEQGGSRTHFAFGSSF